MLLLLKRNSKMSTGETNQKKKVHMMILDLTLMKESKGMVLVSKKIHENSQK